MLRVFLNFLQVVLDVAASAEELSNTFVKEGFEEFGRGSKGVRKDELMEVVERQEQMLGEIQKELYVLKANMSDRKKQGHDKVEDNYYQWDESSVADIGEEKFSEIAQHKSGDIDEGNFVETSTDQHGKEEDGLHQDGKEIQQSNMYVRRMDDQRKCFKSISLRTSFATYSRRKRSQYLI